ncbi:hypothetical protein AJ85_05785 [Alkalihalobacillus alcalophilus ATCC 27647 = CGMCC 1.3604]|uniref:Uncharacterized protein n=1 Tax=Alkalihalobacillus alcalophilus ATCC 27647 = CGMCC 1.3604 TaxID=1218173 RepID=A0A094WJ40_ALKAL|nr:hypothetical protein [Alkalihalobacillus alcalophilus]YP_009276815.1 hypothetical protein BH791_gp09 [Bacillus phage BalMu-1]AJA42387.1 hypothetical protein BalMu1_B9 [Bacillus phage BalMu-1]AJA42443.1 hypothetical protein BalMu1_A9 [Bacillus phage BalMu-1]KGA96846.1 hypothetical protein BALCAV_0213565 [Alkalihalobacillus alcalophilus ATCC 27647 = CGMCC 1.3604]MED1561132.1 hypothetical protein [Alkalihalobacillus alcalophilus]THG91334.1 hypothetical protein AJ85_05785 [Alkalihalobacillus a
MTKTELIIRTQDELYDKFGKVDIYHDEDCRQMLAVPHGRPLEIINVVAKLEYTLYPNSEDVMSVG